MGLTTLAVKGAAKGEETPPKPRLRKEEEKRKGKIGANRLVLIANITHIATLGDLIVVVAFDVSGTPGTWQTDGWFGSRKDPFLVKASASPIRLYDSLTDEMRRTRLPPRLSSSLRL